MRFFAQLIVTVILCFALQYLFPWWSMAIACFVLGYLFKNSGFISFCAGLLGVGLVWLGMALYIDHATASILTDKVAKLFPANIFLLTTVVGGLVGGFASLTGALLNLKTRPKYGMERY